MRFAAIADWVDSGEPFDIGFMCAHLQVSRAGYYAWRGRPASARSLRDAELTSLIGEIHQRLHGNPGVRRVRAELTAAGHWVALKRVWRLMRAAGLQGRHPKAWRRTTLPGSPSTMP